MNSPASPLAIFRRAYFGPIDQYLAWHDGFDTQTDLACLDALAPAERQQAAAELVTALRAGTADARAMLGLGHLRYPDALPLLHDCLRRGVAALYALGAIAEINPAGLYPPLVAACLQARATTEHHSIDLLMGLREYFTLPQLGPLIPPPIFRLLAHKDYLVRYHALETLRRLYSGPAQGPLYNLDALRNDEIFGLIAKDGHVARYGKAQRLLLAELPAATLATYPLIGR
jgi:hypothetical protein